MISLTRTSSTIAAPSPAQVQYEKIHNLFTFEMIEFLILTLQIL